MYLKNVRYDGNRTLIGFKDKSTNKDYFYLKNLQGDIVRIIDSTGNVVVTYEYDAWGKLLSTTGSLASTIGKENPFRYRGYYYDTESSLYYLNSRYYDPETGRFVNADAYVSTGQGIESNNMFMYCSGNPVNGCDPCGNCFHHWQIWKKYDRCKNEDRECNNSDPQVVIEAEYVASYNGVIYIKVGDENNKSAFSFGVVFIGRGVKDEQTVKHEYGHYLQLQELGVPKYTRYIVVPSLGGYFRDVDYHLYYSQPWEYGADLYGGVERKGYEYAENADLVYEVFWDLVNESASASHVTNN